MDKTAEEIVACFHYWNGSLDTTNEKEPQFPQYDEFAVNSLLEVCQKLELYIKQNVSSDLYISTLPNKDVKVRQSKMNHRTHLEREGVSEVVFSLLYSTD